MSYIYATIGFLVAIGGWIILIYAGIRNQNAAKDSPLVDWSNFLPRMRAIIEVILHPDHAAEWERRATKAEVDVINSGKYNYEWQKVTYGQDTIVLIKVFPTLGMDSSEIGGIRMDDGK